LRQLLATHADLAAKLDQLEAKYLEHDKKLVKVFEAIRQLMEPPPPQPKEEHMGFHATR
jgi:hypothetical protein